MDVDLLALLSIIFLSVALVSTLTGYLRLRRKIEHLAGEEDMIKNQARLKARQILDHAQDAAFQIANEAMLKAQESRDLVRAKLEEVATKQIREYQQVLHDSSGDLENEAAKMLALKVDEEFSKAQKEIAGFKKQKTADIDQQATEVLRRVTREVLGRAIDPSVHMDLVKKALVEAKQEYGF